MNEDGFKILAEGAEAKILKLNNNLLKKIRLEKPYRLKEIDIKLRKFRNRREFKILKKLEETKVNSPKAHDLFEIKSKNNPKSFEEISFTFEYLKGNILKEVLNKNLLFKAFDEIIKLHENNIIHLDLTTLNMIELKNEVYLIDFGLSNFSSKIEDKAVDLNLFFTAIKNEHPDLYKFKQNLLENYKFKFENGEKILTRLNQIELRGRNKSK